MNFVWASPVVASAMVFCADWLPREAKRSERDPTWWFQVRRYYLIIRLPTDFPSACPPLPVDLLGRAISRMCYAARALARGETSTGRTAIPERGKKQKQRVVNMAQ